MRFPWMKIHGSIEALCRCLSGNQTQGFHEWKFMALLKRVHSSLHEVIKPVFPWMKIHGSIEAGDVRKNCVQIVLVSMNENSWLYWSQTLDRNDLEYLEVSMNENSWLYWSTPHGLPSNTRQARFHEWKFMALLKQDSGKLIFAR